MAQQRAWLLARLLLLSLPCFALSAQQQGMVLYTPCGEAAEDRFSLALTAAAASRTGRQLAVTGKVADWLESVYDVNSFLTAVAREGLEIKFVEVEGVVPKYSFADLVKEATMLPNIVTMSCAHMEQPGEWHFMAPLIWKFMRSLGPSEALRQSLSTSSGLTVLLDAHEDCSSFPAGGPRVVKAIGHELETSAELSICNFTALTKEASQYALLFSALQAKRLLVGKSYLSKLVFLERRHNKRATFSIEGEYSLLNDPGLSWLFEMPMIFTFNSWSADYHDMMKGAVLSAKANTNFQIFCLFSGNLTRSGLTEWFRTHDVTVVHHNPAWRDQLWERVLPFRERNLAHSHLYATQDMVVGTWQRIDIPIIPEFEPFEYAFFADSDVLFVHSFASSDLAPFLPEAVSMGPEMQDMFPYNAGIMIMNLSSLRLSYKPFLQFILTNDNGMYFPRYGPGDQGAYNQFYEEAVRRDVLPKRFNAKPYHSCGSGTRVVHFHGPKPADYVRYFETGACRFNTLCREGYAGCLCHYAEKYGMFAKRLKLACSVL